MARQDHRNNRQIEPQRLCDAAEAALQAAVERADARTGEWAHPATLVGTAQQPTCLAEFTRVEIEQACEFLVRLGYLQPRRAA